MANILSRVRVSWHALVAALVMALPILLQQLQVVDLKPLLAHYLGDDWATLLVALMPFYIALLKPMISVAPPPEAAAK
jgi:hypothetical protein